VNSPRVVITVTPTLVTQGNTAKEQM